MSVDVTTRATFVMHKSSRDFLKALAARYGVSQSEIMNTAPYLFIVMAERSLARRQAQMSTTKLLAEQALRSLYSFPGHLVIGDVEERIEQAIELEEKSIKQRQVHGPSEGDIYSLMQRGFLPYSDPLKETICSALDEVGAKASVARYRAMLEGVADEEDTFIDDEEEAERAAFLEKLLGESFELDDELDEMLGLSEKTSRQVDTQKSCDRGEWLIMFGDEEFSVHTGVDALEETLKRLVSDDPSRVEKIATVKGSTRLLIAQKAEELYSGRPDLSDRSREFIPGWFMGTNYSRNDVMRLIRAAVEKCDLIWGSDVYVRLVDAQSG